MICLDLPAVLRTLSRLLAFEFVLPFATLASLTMEAGTHLSLPFPLRFSFALGSCGCGCGGGRLVARRSFDTTCGSRRLVGRLLVNSPSLPRKAAQNLGPTVRTAKIVDHCTALQCGLIGLEGPTKASNSCNRLGFANFRLLWLLLVGELQNAFVLAAALLVRHCETAKHQKQSASPVGPGRRLLNTHRCRLEDANCALRSCFVDQARVKPPPSGWHGAEWCQPTWRRPAMTTIRGFTYFMAAVYPSVPNVSTPTPIHIQASSRELLGCRKPNTPFCGSKLRCSSSVSMSVRTARTADPPSMQMWIVGALISARATLVSTAYTACSADASKLQMMA
eukprot:scaffold742_cov263-Pinguiococcus_pyrenoidosus.AAC.11